jgi:hypothetical protein
VKRIDFEDGLVADGIEIGARPAEENDQAGDGERAADDPQHGSRRDHVLFSNDV